MDITSQVVQTFHTGGVPQQGFFPVGLFFATPGSLGYLASSGFNYGLVMPGDMETFIAEAQRVGISLAVDQRHVPGLFDIYKAHPQVYAWYLADEPRTEEAAGLLEWAYAVMAPVTSHILFIGNLPAAMLSPDLWNRLINIGDAACHDNYRTDLSSFHSIAAGMRQQAQAIPATKPSWFIPQAFEAVPWRFISPFEFRAIVYTAIVHGATGLLYFAWDSEITRSASVIGIHPNPPERYSPTGFPATRTQRLHSRKLWWSMRSINGQIARSAPIILSPTSVDYQVHGDATAAANLRMLGKIYNNSPYVIAVNMGRNSVSAIVDFPEYRLSRVLSFGPLSAGVFSVEGISPAVPIIGAGAVLGAAAFLGK